MASTTNFGYSIGDVLKEYLDDPIFILNKDYEFEYGTETFDSKSLGLTDLECKLTDILHPNDFQVGVDFLQRVLKFEQAVETLRVKYGDTSRFYEFKGRLFKNETHETKYLITTRDITQFKKKEEDWNKMEKVMEKSAETMQEIRFWKLLQTKDEKSSFQKSREVLNQIIDNIKEGYFEVDLEGNFTFLNKSFTQMYGYSYDKMIGKNYKHLMDDENKVKVFNIFNSVYKSGLPQENVQFNITQKGDTKATVETSVYLNINTSGKKLGFYGITRDITQRFNLELKLKRSEEKYRHLFESSPYAIWIVDLNGVLIDCNPTTNIMFSNDTRGNLVGKHFVEVLGMLERPEYFIPFFKSKFEGFVRDKQIKALEFKMIRADGIEKWIHITSSKINLGDDTFIQAIIQDITEKKIAELKLQRSEEELKILNKELENKVQERTKELIESEEHFRTIAEHSTIGITILQDEKIIYANEAMSRINGFTNKEMRNWTSAELVNQVLLEDREHAIYRLKGRLTGALDISDTNSYRITTKDGTIKWIESFSKTITYQGKIADLALIMDVTEQKRAEKKLKESEEKYRHLFENAPFSIVLLSFEGKIIEMNAATTKLFGYQKEDLIDKSYLSLTGLFPKETIPGLRLVDDLMSKGEPSDPIMKPQITQIYNKDKKAMWVASELSAVNIRGELMILAIIQDITEKKLAEEKLKESERILRQQNIELKELDRLKTDFISIAAHDLKTPLISVGGYVDLILLREKGLTEEIKEDLNRVLSNVHRLDGYINRLLDVMKIEAKKVELVKREENIHSLIINCLSDLEFQVSQKDLTVNVNVLENLNISVDNFRISQALLNLLSNAVKFTPKNGKIDISIVEEDQNVLFKIKDNGKGLTPEEIQKLFGKFVTIEQGVDGSSTLDKGTGLGLYIARGFIEAHGGKIWVESKGRDLGAVFSFTLPKQ